MYPRVFKMLGFQRGSCPPLHVFSRGRKTAQKWGSRQRRIKGAGVQPAAGMMNELERMMEKRRKRRLERATKNISGHTDSGSGISNDSAGRHLASDVVSLKARMKKKSRSQPRKLFCYYPKDRLSELRLFGSHGDFGVQLACENAWHRLEDNRGEPSHVTWCLFEFVKPARDVAESLSVDWLLVPGAEGSGGLAGMNAFLKGSGVTGAEQRDTSRSVMFGGFRVDAVDERESVVSRRCKLIHVTFFGEKTKAKLRSNAGLHRGHIAEVCVGYHASMHVAGLQGLLQEEEVKSVLLSATGSHKPTRFDFF